MLPLPYETARTYGLAFGPAIAARLAEVQAERPSQHVAMPVATDDGRFLLSRVTAMESYCALITDGVVANVTVCDNAEWCSQHLGGEWVCTGERLVGVGWPVVDGEIVEPPPPADA